MAMGKLVVIKIGEGSFELGFPVTLYIGDEGDRFHTSFDGKLPPEPQLPLLYGEWQSEYRSFFRLTLINKKAEELIKTLNNWLNSETFRPIKEKLLKELQANDTVQMIIQTEDPILRRLPWCQWDWFKDYTKAEVAISLPNNKRPHQLVQPKPKVRVLGILGECAHPNTSIPIDTDPDKQFWERLTDAEPIFLEKPTLPELTKKLWDEQGWDILFFAGHSSSNPDATTGKISVTINDFLTILDLENALKKAIEGGLQLAIFNACDGLGLAKNLAELNIPQIIVMREPILDPVAQKFLEYFLKAFSSGQSLYLAVREAREKLQGLEKEYPCASWLPVICQNPTEVPFKWSQLFTNKLIINPSLVEEIIAAGAKDEFFLFKEPNSCDLPKIVVVGTSVVGKSSLVNALFGGRDVVRVSSVPQDDEQTVEENWAGLFKIIDSVSYDEFREQEVEISIKCADVVVQLWDINAIRRNDLLLYQLITKNEKPCITAINKCEQYAPDERQIIIHKYKNVMSSIFIEISVKAKENLSQLVSLIIKELPIELQSIAIEKIASLEKIYQCRKVCKQIILETQMQADVMISYLMNEPNLLTELQKLHIIMVEKIEQQYIKLVLLKNNTTEPLKKLYTMQYSYSRIKKT